MIIFLYGQDSYRSKKKLGEIINHYKESGKSGLSLIYVDADKEDFLDFYSNFKIISMFGEKKLIILKNLFSNKKFQEDMLNKIEKIESINDIVVVYEKEDVDRRLKVFNALFKKCKTQEFKLLDDKNLKIWAQKEFEIRGQKINIDALTLLLNYIGTNLWQFSNEIQKLCSFKEGLVIKKEDVELLIRPKIETDIFKTIDFLADKNKKQVFLLLQKHLDNGDNALYLFSMIQYQFRNLLVVKELSEKGLMYSSIVKKSGLHPFVVKKNYFQCRSFSLPELKNIYYKIFQIDFRIKTGKIEPEIALDMLVASI